MNTNIMMFKKLGIAIAHVCFKVSIIGTLKKNLMNKVVQTIEYQIRIILNDWSHTTIICVTLSIFGKIRICDQKHKLLEKQ